MSGLGASGGAVTWLKLPGEPREHYLARMQWADAQALLVQQLNRLQNTERFLLADASTGAVREMWRDHDDAGGLGPQPVGGTGVGVYGRSRSRASAPSGRTVNACIKTA